MRPPSLVKTAGKPSSVEVPGRAPSFITRKPARDYASPQALTCLRSPSGRPRSLRFNLLTEVSRRSLVRCICLISGAAACALIIPLTTQSQEQPADLGARLAKIRADVASTEKIIEKLKADFGKLKKGEKQVESEIRRLSDDERSMLDQSMQVLRRKEKLTVDLRAAEQRVAQQQSLVRDRLRVLYMNAAVSDRSMVLGAVDSGQIERVAVYASSLRNYDQMRFREVSQAVEDLVVARRALDKTLEEGKALQEGLHVKRTELEGQKGKLRDVMQEIQNKQQAAKRSLTSLTSEAEKLEELMRRIMSAGDAESEQTPQVDEREQSEDKPERPALVDGGRPADVMHPGGLFAQTAKVSYPVHGEIVQRFGKNKVTTFADMIFNKGLEYKTPEGSQVKAVLGGRVAFAGVMPGYDTVVIIDHGQRSYSLYGRLGKGLVKQGDLVKRGDLVGVTSAADSKGRNFYFETRKNGSPVDPGSVLARAS